MTNGEYIVVLIGVRPIMLEMSARLPGENNINFSYRAIREGILSLELKPGQLLNVGELSETLKVSSTPIKNALWKLQQEHLVDLIPQVGSYVSNIDLELVEEAANMWFDLEKECLKSACHVFPKDSLNQLKRNLNFQEMLLGQQPNFLNQREFVGEFCKLDEEFHSIIFDGHGRNTTWKAVSHMAADYHRMIMLKQVGGHVEQMIEEHKDIISMIEKREKEQVETILRNHIFRPMDDWRIGHETGISEFAIT